MADEKITPSSVTEVIHYKDGTKEIEVLASEKSKFAKNDYDGNEIKSTYLKKTDAESTYVKKTDKASTSNYGVVKVGVGLEINSSTGALDVTSAGKVDWSGVVNRPFNSVDGEDFTIEGTTDIDKVLKLDASKWATISALDDGLALKLDKADFTATNIVSKLGTTAVNRATSDASGNVISSTYETKANVKTELAKKLDTSTHETFVQTVADTYETKTDASTKKKALEDAIALKVATSDFNTYVNTTAPATYLGINDVASATKLGAIKIGYTEADRKFAVKLDNANKAYVEVPEYELPNASATTLGGIKIGSGLAISDEGVASVDVNGIDVKWTKVSGKPFTSVSSDDFVTTDNSLGINSANWLSTSEASRTYETITNVASKENALKKEISDKIGALDYTSKGAEGSYVQKVSEADGVISETIKAFDSSISAGSTSVNAPTSKAVESRIQAVIGGLDVAQVGSNGKFIELVSQADGKLSASSKDFIDSIDGNADSLIAPTTKAIKKYVDDLVAAGVDIVVVTELPTASKDTKGKIYLVKHEHSTSDAYDEYVTVTGGTSATPTYVWEKIGSTDIDLSAYAKGSNLTSNKIILGDGGVNLKASTIGIATTLGSDDTSIPTSKAIQTSLANYVPTTTTINGHALSGNVTITKSDVALGNVANTGDSATPVANGTTKFTTGGAYTLKSNLETSIGKKQDKLTTSTGILIDSSNNISVNLVAGSGISISGNTISSNIVATSVTIDY